MLKTLERPVETEGTKVKEAPSCPYCGGVSELTSSKEVYGGRDYGPIYICRPCEAWVGCHVGTTKPLGRLANAELRKAKQAAHKAFDPLWMKGYIDRRDAYAWLAQRLGIPGQLCHIGMMDVETCWKVVQVCLDVPAIYTIKASGFKAAFLLDEGDRVKYAKGDAKQFLGMKIRSVESRCRQNKWELDLVDNLTL